MNPFSKFRLSRKKSVLLKNTVMLYILTFSTYLMSFIVVPYETRILGTAGYGLLGVATAMMVYFQLVIDFGFILSATEEVSRNREDKRYLSQIFTAVTLNKLLLTLVSGIVLFALCWLVPRWQEHALFFFLFFLATAINSLIPDYLYRGIEQMSAITIRTVLIKFFFTVMIFLLLKSPSDYCVIPLLNIIGNLGALLGVYVHLFRKVGIRFARITRADFWRSFRQSNTFFLSRIASTAYTAANTVILDILSAGTSTAFYSSADKLITTAKNGLSPISDSLYPYMTKNRDFKLVKKVLCIIMPVILAGCAVVFIWADRTGAARDAPGRRRDPAELHPRLPDAERHGAEQIRKLLGYFWFRAAYLQSLCAVFQRPHEHDHPRHPRFHRRDCDPCVPCCGHPAPPRAAGHAAGYRGGDVIWHPCSTSF